MWKFLHSHVGVQLEVSCLVANSKVVLGHLWFGSVEAHLVAGEPALIADDSGSVDGWASEVKVNITAHVNVFALVGSLDFAALLADDEKYIFG